MFKQIFSDNVNIFPTSAAVVDTETSHKHQSFRISGFTDYSGIRDIAGDVRYSPRLQRYFVTIGIWYAGVSGRTSVTISTSSKAAVRGMLVDGDLLNVIETVYSDGALNVGLALSSEWFESECEE